ncbi:MAG: hypothetical protein WCT53_01360 [Candidatus Gracilibacteria bacterium]
MRGIAGQEFRLEELRDKVKHPNDHVVAVACPDAECIEMLKGLSRQGIGNLVFEIGSQNGVPAERNPRPMTLEHAESTDPAIAAAIQASIEASVKAIVDGSATALMKGCVNTKQLMGTIFRENRLRRAGDLWTHFACYEEEGYDQAILSGDEGVVKYPNPSQRGLIAEGMARAYRLLFGIEPNIAVLAPNETDFELMPEFEGGPRGFKLGGPYSVEVALLPGGAEHKGIKPDDVAGRAHCLLQPDYRAGNTYHKTHEVSYAMRGVDRGIAGTMAGPRFPFIVTSRGDNERSKRYSTWLSLALSELGYYEGAGRV